VLKLLDYRFEVMGCVELGGLTVGDVDFMVPAMVVGLKSAMIANVHASLAEAGTGKAPARVLRTEKKLHIKRPGYSRIYTKTPIPSLPTQYQYNHTKWHHILAHIFEPATPAIPMDDHFKP